MVNRIKLHLVLVIILISSGSLGLAQDRATYDRYISTYQAYQNAITQHLSAEETMAKLQEYLAAKTAYDKESNNGQPASATAGTASTPPAAQAPDLGDSAILVQAQAQAQGNFAPVSSELKSIVKELWVGSGKSNADSLIKKLETFIAKTAGVEKARAQYELAKAYEWYKADNAKAQQVLTNIATNAGSGYMAQLAKDRLTYLKASAQHDQWKNVLQGKQGAMDNQYKNYRETSWLAFPVKLTRWCGYVGKIFSFDGAKDDFKKFQLWYEDMAAKYSPPPEIVFDLFVPADGKQDYPESSVRLVYDNFEAWYSRWNLINQAKHSVDIQYFIVDTDIFGNSLNGLLLKKAKEGLKIRYMMDARGTKGFTRKFMDQAYLQELARFPNVDIKVFNPVHQDLVLAILDPRKVMASDHDKIVVVDEEYAIVGGRNISKDYFVNPPDHPTAYKDCDVVIHDSDIARQLDIAFMEEFTQLKQYEIVEHPDISCSLRMEAACQAMDTYLSRKVFYNFRAPQTDKKVTKALGEYNQELSVFKHMTGYSGFQPLQGAHECPVKIIDKDSISGFRNDITDQIVRFMDAAKSEIIIQNPYVVLTERAEAAMIRASKRGVRIIMHTNSPVSTDSLATQAMFYADWKRIMKAMPTMQIYVFTGQRKLHAKTFVFDRKVSVIGTYNMDFMSEEINSEVVAAMKSNEFSTEHRSNIMNDLKLCKQYQISVDEKGDANSVYGPDDLKTSKSWMIKVLSKLTFLKKII